MPDADEIVMCVDRKILFNNEKDVFQGFIDAKAKKIAYNARIVNHSQFIRHGNLDARYDLKQPIAYCAIVNPSKDLLYVYQRANGTNVENKLTGRWSIGVGGHIGQEDMQPMKDPISLGLSRERRQEIRIVNGEITQPEFIGYINDDLNDVGREHIGVVYLGLTDATQIYPKDTESKKGNMWHMRGKSIEEVCLENNGTIESWTEIALRELRRRFNWTNL